MWGGHHELIPAPHDPPSLPLVGAAAAAATQNQSPALTCQGFGCQRRDRARGRGGGRGEGDGGGLHLCAVWMGRGGSASPPQPPARWEPAGKTKSNKFVVCVFRRPDSTIPQSSPPPRRLPASCLSPQSCAFRVTLPAEGVAPIDRRIYRPDHRARMPREVLVPGHLLPPPAGPQPGRLHVRNG